MNITEQQPIPWPKLKGLIGSAIVKPTKREEAEAWCLVVDGFPLWAWAGTYIPVYVRELLSQDLEANTRPKKTDDVLEAMGLSDEDLPWDGKPQEQEELPWDKPQDAEPQLWDEPAPWEEDSPFAFTNEAADDGTVTNVGSRGVCIGGSEPDPTPSEEPPTIAPSAAAATEGRASPVNTQAAEPVPLGIPCVRHGSFMIKTKAQDWKTGQQKVDWFCPDCVAEDPKSVPSDPPSYCPCGRTLREIEYTSADGVPWVDPVCFACVHAKSVAAAAKDTGTSCQAEDPGKAATPQPVAPAPGATGDASEISTPETCPDCAKEITKGSSLESEDGLRRCGPCHRKRALGLIGPSEDEDIPPPAEGEKVNVYCPVCGSNSVCKREDAPSTCDCGNARIAVWPCGQVMPDMDYGRILALHGRRTQLGDPQRCVLCPGLIGNGQSVYQVPKCKRTVAHVSCVEADVGPEQAWLSNREAALVVDDTYDCTLCLENVNPGEMAVPHPDTEGSMAHLKCVDGHDQPIAADDSRDPCEWNPKLHRKAQPGDAWHAKATLIVGSGKNSARLCKDCRGRPPWNRKRKVQEIEA